MYESLPMAILCQLLQCERDDIERLKKAKYDWPTVMAHSKALAQTAYQKTININYIWHAIVETGKAELEEYRIQRLHPARNDDFVSERDESAQDAMGTIDPMTDIVLCNGPKGPVAEVRRNQGLYRTWMRGELSRFEWRTGIPVRYAAE